MKIDGIKAQNIYESYAKNNSKKVEKADIKASGDRVEISAKASDMNLAKKITSKETAPVEKTSREERINEIKSRIDAGNYSVPSSDVARSMVKGRIFDKKI